MMHTLTLLRHAKSDQSVSVNDKDRPLNERGLKDAPEMAKRVLERGYMPDLMITSDALRTETTAKVFAGTLGSELFLEEALYNTDAVSVIKMIHEVNEEVTDLMLIGHNPTWEMLAEYFSDEDITMPTCAIVQISFDCSWSEVTRNSGKIIYFDYPKKEV